MNNGKRLNNQELQNLLSDKIRIALKTTELKLPYSVNELCNKRSWPYFPFNIGPYSFEARFYEHQPENITGTSSTLIAPNDYTANTELIKLVNNLKKEFKNDDKNPRNMLVFYEVKRDFI